MATRNSLVYGIHALAAILASRPHDVLSIHWQQKQPQNPRVCKLLQQAEQLGIAQQQQLNLPAWLQQQHGIDGVNHQGVVALVRPKPLLNEKDLKAQLQQQTTLPRLFVVLDGITDAHNVGAIMRTAEAAGVSGVIVLKHHSAPLNATVHKTSSGAIEFLAIYRVTNLARTLQLLQQAGVWTMALTLSDAPSPYSQHDWFEQDLSMPLALVLGSEDKGIRALNLQYCDVCVTLPMLGVTQSLNVANTASIAVYEVLRQRRVAKRL